MNKIKNILVVVIAGLVVTAVVTAAWSGPTSEPPTGGDDLAALNIGSGTQLKTGGLGIDGVLNVSGQGLFYNSGSSVSVAINKAAASCALDVNGVVNATSVIITDAPSNSTDAANKAYVDTEVAGGSIAGTTQIVPGVPAPGGGTVDCPVGTIATGGGSVSDPGFPPVTTFSEPSLTNGWTVTCDVMETCTPSVICLQ